MNRLFVKSPSCAGIDVGPKCSNIRSIPYDACITYGLLMSQCLYELTLFAALAFKALAGIHLPAFCMAEKRACAYLLS